jgi:hypothetical protein
MFAEFRNFLLLIPLFVVAATTLKNKTVWRLSILAFSLAGTWVAGMGLLEYLFPGIGALFPGFISNAHVENSGDGFLKATFSFWGTSDAVFICTLTVPVAIIAWQWWSAYWQRWLILGMLVTQLAGIYVSGHRSMWVTLALAFLLWTWLRRKPIVLAAALFSGQIGYQFLPASLQLRLLTLIGILQRHSDTGIDSSGADRWWRVTVTFDKILTTPWGRGWTSAGWVHSDFLQVAANLGVLAGLLLLGAYLLTAWRMVRRLRHYPLGDEWGALGLALFLSLVVVGCLLTMEAVTVLPQLVLPPWFVWVLAEIWLRQDDRLKNEGVNEI